MDELAKHIERSLKKRGFYLVLEDELERCWPSEKIKRADREKQIQVFAKSHGWTASMIDTDSGLMRAIFVSHSRRERWSPLVQMPMQKRSRKEWRDLIRIEFKGKGGNRHCSATCPICRVSYDVESLSSDASARWLAVGKVASHINRVPFDVLTDYE